MLCGVSSFTALPRPGDSTQFEPGAGRHTKEDRIMQGEETLKIIELKVSNVKRLRAITIKPDGNLVVVGGDNGEGKTSTLDAIWMALGGAKAIPDEPVRRGTTKATVELNLGELVVRRTFAKKGTTSLAVFGANGVRQKSPQAILDALTGSLSFDPLSFLRLDAKAQAETLRQLVGLDLSELGKKRQAAYDERAGVNRDVKRLEGALASMRHHPDAPDAAVSVAQLAEELRAGNAKNAANDRKRAALEDARANAVRQKAKVESLREQIKEAEAEFEIMQSAGKALAAEINDLVDVDTGNLAEAIENAESTNEKVRANAERARIDAELNEKAEVVAGLTAKLEQIDGVKADAIAKAQYPVDGLGVSDVGVTYNDLPFDQASQAQQLQASVAIGLALNPRLKVLLVRDGSLLDRNSLAAVAAQAEAAGAQIWLERVGEGDECSVIIEDGAVRTGEGGQPGVSG